MVHEATYRQVVCFFPEHRRCGKHCLWTAQFSVSIWAPVGTQVPFTRPSLRRSVQLRKELSDGLSFLDLKFPFDPFLGSDPC